jgi:hypothetical protein
MTTVAARRLPDYKIYDHAIELKDANNHHGGLFTLYQKKRLKSFENG